MRKKATVATIKVFKGNFSKNKEGANVHPSSSFRKCPLMPFFMGKQIYVREGFCPEDIPTSETIHTLTVFLRNNSYHSRLQYIDGLCINKHGLQLRKLISWKFIYASYPIGKIYSYRGSYTRRHV